MGATTNIACAEWLRLAAARHPNRPCLVTDQETFSFEATNRRVNRLASALADRGVGVGDRIALLAANSHRYVETLFASMLLGATYVPLNFRLAPKEVETLLARAAVRVVVVDARHTAMLASQRERLVSIEHVVDLDGTHGGDIDYEQLLESGQQTDRHDTPSGDEAMLGLCYTSGTTALPKGVIHSQRMVRALTMQTIVERRLPADAFHYSPAPLFHVAGMVYAFAGIARGCPSLIMDFESERVLWWMQQGGLNGCFFVPTMLSTLLDHPAVGDADYELLHSIAYGASPITVPLLRRAIDTFRCDFMNLFGAGTEAGMQTLLTPDDHRRALAGEERLLQSIGKQAFGVDLRLCDEAMRDVPDGETGEIVTRGDGVMAGYLDMPDETAEAIVGGWFRGGDLAWRDEDGYLYLAGRRKDTIIRGGENVYPLEIETVLADYRGVVESAVVGVEDAHWGEVVRAHVVMAEGAFFDPQDIRHFCGERLASYKVPIEVRREVTLPKNASGKVLKRELRTW
ncbi:MAG: class I adenylate-forming enzyme family protein [Desertimonas sp.]